MGGRYGRRVTSCARPACSDPVAGLMLVHRADRIAELLPLDDQTGRRYGVGLCAGHLARVKAPMGWDVIDRLSVAPVSSVRTATVRPRVHGAPGSATNPSRPVWVPSSESDVEDVPELRTAKSPLLRRAFQGGTLDEGQIEGQLRLLV